MPVVIEMFPRPLFSRLDLASIKMSGDLPILAENGLISRPHVAPPCILRGNDRIELIAAKERVPRTFTNFTRGKIDAA